VGEWASTGVGAPFAVPRRAPRFLGNIASSVMSASSLDMAKALWGGELPAFDSVDAVDQLLRALVTGRRNRLARCRAPKVRFATDSPLEGDGFEPSVPRQRKALVEAASFARDRNRERTSNANVTCSGRGSAPIAAPAPALPQSGLTRDYYADALVGATEVAQGVPPQTASASLDDLGGDGKRNFGRLDAVNVEACWRLQARQAILG
jgi:hypothetical protein